VVIVRLLILLITEIFRRFCLKILACIVFLTGLSILSCSQSPGGGSSGHGNESSSSSSYGTNGLSYYTVTYNGKGNTGGTVPVDPNRYTNGQSVTVLGNTGNLTDQGYSLSGWSNASGTFYYPGQTFSMGTANVNLYAVWIAYTYLSSITPSLATDGKGSFYVAYSDSDNGGKATVMKYTASTGWTVVGKAGFSAGQTAWTSIAIDSSDMLYVAYEDFSCPASINSETNGGKATVMKFNGSSWSTLGSSGFSSGKAVNTCIKLDNYNNPYIVYSDASLGGSAIAKEYVGGNWVTVGSGGFTPGPAGYESLSLDNSGNIYVGYCDESIPNTNCASLQMYAGSVWTQIYGAGWPVLYNGSLAYTNYDVSQFISIAVNRNGTVYIAYYDLNYGVTLLSNINLTSWNYAGWDSESTTPGSISLSIDPVSSTPYIAYSDESFYSSAISNWVLTNSLVVLSYTASGCNPVGNYDFSPGVSSSVSLIATNGTPYVAFADMSAGNHISVMYYNGSIWTYLGSSGFSLRRFR
jgi:hypothetical protein